MFSLLENTKIIPVMRPIDKTGAAFTTEWISMKNAEKATFVVNLGVMTSTSNQAVTLKVANDASGTKSKVITSASAACTLELPHYWKTTTGDTLAKTSVTSSTFNLTKSSDAKYVIIEVEAAKMGTFISSSVTYQADYLALSVATPGAHACLAAVDCFLTGLRYQQNVPPTAIT
jgi:hypothetical protein